MRPKWWWWWWWWWRRWWWSVAWLKMLESVFWHSALFGAMALLLRAFWRRRRWWSEFPMAFVPGGEHRTSCCSTSVLRSLRLRAGTSVGVAALASLVGGRARSCLLLQQVVEKSAGGRIGALGNSCCVVLQTDEHLVDMMMHVVDKVLFVVSIDKHFVVELLVPALSSGPTDVGPGRCVVPGLVGWLLLLLGGGVCSALGVCGLVMLMYFCSTWWSESFLGKLASPKRPSSLAVVWSLEASLPILPS